MRDRTATEAAAGPPLTGAPSKPSIAAGPAGTPAATTTTARHLAARRTPTAQNPPAGLAAERPQDRATRKEGGQS